MKRSYIIYQVESTVVRDLTASRGAGHLGAKGEEEDQSNYFQEDGYSSRKGKRFSLLLFGFSLLFCVCALLGQLGGGV